MTFELTEGARSWRDKIKTFVDGELIPHEVEAELAGGVLAKEIRASHREKALTLGLPGMDAPKTQGGLGLSMLEQAVIHEQIGRVTNGLGWCFGEAQGWMFQACSPMQIENYVLPILEGRRHECYAITEAGPGSDVEAIEATARREDSDYVLDGEKWFLTGFNLADFCFFQAKIAGGGNDWAHALFFVDLDTPGIEVIENPPFSHNFEAHHPTVRFRNVRVPDENRIGAEGDGMSFTHAWFRHERLMIAARCCGAAGRLIEEASKFVQSRHVGGEALSEKQLVQMMLAESATELWAARLMTYEAAAAHDRGDDFKALHARCSMAKLFASEMAGRVADRSVQLFGGRGYRRDNVAERFYRELRVDRIWEGTSEVQKLIIARGILKRGLQGNLG